MQSDQIRSKLRHPWEAPRDTVRVLQFTDTHLFANPDTLFNGLNTARSLEETINHGRAHCWPPDLILATGDLVQDETREAYEHFVSAFQPLAIPTYCLPGNHDVPALMREMLADEYLQCPDYVRRGHWLIVLVDTSIPGSTQGHLSTKALTCLDACLQENSELHSLICLHHPPIHIASPWLDTIAVDNPDDFFQIVDRFPQVRGLLWGHIHQEFDAERNGVRLLSSPSTCIQFQPRSEQFALDAALPGYRWLLLHGDGTIETGVNRIGPSPSDGPPPMF